MRETLRPKPGILEIALYEGGASALAGRDDVIKLSSNENPHGPSAKAEAAYRAASGSLHRYPPTDHAALRAAIGEVHGLDPARIICGTGSDEVLILLSQAYGSAGDEVIYTQHGFLLYPILARSVGAVPVKVAERDRRVDPDAILRAVTDRTRIVFIANPNNPTGTLLDAGALADLAAALPPSVLLVLDGAYAEFVAGFDGGAALVDRFDNVVMTRTFSKIYGLGGLRIGWGYASRAIIDTLNRIRNPFNLSQGQLAAAEAALRDRDYLTWCQGENARLRSWLAEALAAVGVPSDPSFANFILARFASAEEAAACDAHLKSEGILVRRVDGYGLPHCLRITIGDGPACQRVASAVSEFMAGRPGEVA